MMPGRHTLHYYSKLGVLLTIIDYQIVLISIIVYLKFVKLICMITVVKLIK